MSHTKQHVGILYIDLTVSYGMLGPGARSLSAFWEPWYEIVWEPISCLKPTVVVFSFHFL